MAAYDFSTLNDKDFEELSRDLLSIILGVRLQSFKVGPDKGIDLRHSSPAKNNKIVVQAKHYHTTGFKGLLASLKKERNKVKNLRPTRYIISTSVRLSPQNKDEILSILSPYLKSANDIFGNEDLNKILSDYPDAESKYYKLWLTSINVLKRILNNSVKGRSEFYTEKIKNNIKIYVQNSSLTQAFKILEKYRFLLITGQPGVGKTTLAYIAIYSFLSKGYELVFIDKDIIEGENLFDVNPNAKQVFYFDDFLGANYFEIINPKSSDSGIVNFVERIQKSKNKYLILTTRTTILNTAKQYFEKINRSNLDIARKELELKDYNEFDKARILYNHLYFSDLEERNRDKIFRNKNYWKIIRHENYNPRLIEFITSQNKFIQSEIDNYLEFVMYNLRNPNELWLHSYENQIKDEDRFFITTLFSFGSDVEHSVLEKAFEIRIKHEIKRNGFQKPNDVFNSCIKRLIDGFITRYQSYGGLFEFSFVNPSINDFLISYLKKSKAERWRLFDSCFYIEQFESLFKYLILDFTDYNEFIREANRFIDLLKFRRIGSSGKYRNIDTETFLIIKKAYLYINSCDVDPPFLHVDPLGKRAIIVRA